MALFTGYFALGTGYGPSYVFQEVSGGSYARVAASLTGAYNTGVSQTITTFAAATTPAGLPMRLWAIFDASTNGNILVSGELNTPLTAVGTAQPSTVFTITLLQGVISSMANLGDMFAQGSMIGFCNGNPMVANNTLIASSAGNLTYEPAQGTIVSNALFMNGGVAVGRFDSSGNLLIKGNLTTLAVV